MTSQEILLASGVEVLSRRLPRGAEVSGKTQMSFLATFGSWDQNGFITSYPTIGCNSQRSNVPIKTHPDTQVHTGNHLYDMPYIQNTKYRIYDIYNKYRIYDTQQIWSHQAPISTMFSMT